MRHSAVGGSVHRPQRRSAASLLPISVALLIGLSVGYSLCRWPRAPEGRKIGGAGEPQPSSPQVDVATAGPDLQPSFSALPQLPDSDHDRFEQMPHDDATGSGIVPYIRRRLNSRGELMLVPVNAAYVDFGLNLICSLRNISRRLSGGASFYEGREARGFAFVALDAEAFSDLRAMHLPVFRDPKVPFVSSKSAAWADPKFHMLVCTKLLPTLRLLKAGISVLLADADIVFLRDVAANLRTDVDVTFSIGSCHRDLPDNFAFAPEGIEKLNTGFYFAHPRPSVVSLLERAYDRCRTTSMSGDQPAMNAVLLEDQKTRKGAGGDGSAGKNRADYSYAFFDGCQVANGCVYFKHLCENATYSPRAASELLSASLPKRSDPAVVHANFLVGRKDKIKHLRKYGLWDDGCISEWRKGAS